MIKHANLSVDFITRRESAEHSDNGGKPVPQTRDVHPALGQRLVFALW